MQKKHIVNPIRSLSRPRKCLHLKKIINCRIFNHSESFSFSWKIVTFFSPIFRQFWNQLTGSSPFYHFLANITSAPVVFRKVFFVKKLWQYCLDCGGVASGRVFYQQSYTSSLMIYIRVFLVLHQKQSATRKTKNIFRFCLNANKTKYISTCFINKKNHTQFDNHNMQTI